MKRLLYSDDPWFMEVFDVFSSVSGAGEMGASDTGFEHGFYF